MLTLLYFLPLCQVQYLPFACHWFKYLFIISIWLSAESVFARCLSAIKNDRVEASKSLVGPENTKFEGDKEAFIEDIRQVDIPFFIRYEVIYL